MNPIETQAKAFETFLAAKGRARSTIAEVLRKLKRFLDYLAARDIVHIDGITREMVRAYQVTVYQTINAKGRLNGMPYQNSLMAAVKQFTAFLRETELIIADPAGNIPYAKEPQQLPRSILTPSEARRILAAPDVKSVIGYRDRTMLEILYVTGIRKAELENLTLGDVDYHDGFLRINNAKGGKDRVVPLGRIACRYLENYIKSVRPELVRDPLNQHVFLSDRGRRLNPSLLWIIIKRYARKAGIKKNIHCHTFRHSCATSMLKNKANIRAIQELLGHKTLHSTQVYTHVSINDLKEVHRQCHPREKDKE